jgi:hypothetical protein
MRMNGNPGVVLTWRTSDIARSAIEADALYGRARKSDFWLERYWGF